MSDQLAAAMQALALSWWLAPALFLLCALDGIVPVVPSEAAVIAAAVLAMTTPARLTTVVLAAALGSFTGDYLCYVIARWLHRTTSGRCQAAALVWADGVLRRHGGRVILMARFVPSGRTAVNLTAGLTGFPLRRFLAWDALAASSWAVYICVFGLLGAGMTNGHAWYGALVGLGLSLAVTLVITLVRRWRGSRPRRAPAEPPAHPKVPAAR
jgi:membrane protein DedA with SNARE-associated domain